MRHSNFKTTTITKVFSTNSTQLDVYNEVVKPMVTGLVANSVQGTVFTYGESGSGKTFTMQGDISIELNKTSLQLDPLDGIIARSVWQILDELTESGQKYSVTISYFEIFEKHVIDLLDDSNKILRIYSPNGKILIQSDLE